MKKRFGVITAMWLMSAASVFADPVQARGRIEGVTVYRGQALVTRVVEVPKDAADAATGLTEIVITDLPSKVILASLHAEAGNGVAVRSVMSRARPVGNEDREEVRRIDERIRIAEEQLAANQRHMEVMGEQRAYLKSLEGFVAPTSAAELTKGVLNAETIERLTSFIMEQREEIANRDLELAKERRDVTAALELAQRERQVVAAGSSRTVNEAVVLVIREARGGGAGELRLRYLVTDASWTPSYNVRRGDVGNGRPTEGIVLEYYASIQQMSGEDWSNVSMTLSTATPALAARAPSLTAWKIGLQDAQSQAMEAPRHYLAERAELSKKKDEAALRWQNREGQEGLAQAGAMGDVVNISSLNKLARDIQVLDLVAGERVQREGGRAKMPADENLSVTYAIGGRATLPSRDDRQLVQISSMPMKAAFTKIAAPVLTGEVYDEATAINEGGTVLLAGPVTAYSDGAFVGTGELPTTAVGQSFTVGFGIDSSLRTARELVDRTEKTQGGNRIVELTYRLTLENFGTKPAAVRLLDRLPKTDSPEVRVELVMASPEISSAAEYLQGERKDGILRWDVSVPAQSIGRGAFAVEYKFRLEYDRQRMLAGME